MALNRILDFIFVIYFLTHIPITILVDSQAVIPQQVYPKILRDTLEWYCREFKDPMMMDPPSWFKSFCVCELLFQFPFFFVAAYAFWKGNCAWIRLPALTYGAHVATTVIPIIAHILYHDFSSSEYPGPSTQEERYTLAAIYSPYLIIPLLIVFRMLFSSEYTVTNPQKSNVTGAGKKKYR